MADSELQAPRPFHERPLVYVAGPYTRPDPVLNTRVAIEAAEQLHATGLATCVVPHITLLWHLAAPHDVDYWYGLDLATLRRCDALYRIPGASSGADDEVAFAKGHAIPVFDDYAALLRWLETR